jgi:membrane-bound lytic murein transglycosylase A
LGDTILEPASFQQIPGWRDDDHAEALSAFSRSAAEILDAGRGFTRPVQFGGARDQWLAVCRKARETRDARAFFEDEFQAYVVRDPVRPQGLFTGYYEPLAEGSLTPSPDFPVPIYGKPHDLTPLDGAAAHGLGLKYGRIANGHASPYFTRKEIEQGALAGRGLELVWLKNWADAFFIHIQGSGRVSLPDGRFLRLAYAAKSGRAYTGIGRLLVDRGLLPEDDMSMQSLRRWMAANPEEARELMWRNESFIFFRIVDEPSDDLGAPGAQQVPLHPLRSLAVDRGAWAFGTPVWLDTEAAMGPGQGMKPFRRLMVAQDTGTAIKGYARGDVYWGWGEVAAYAAGHMKSPGTMTVLLPKSLQLDWL